MPGTRLYVGNLTPSVTGDELREIFSGYGPIDRVDMKKDGYAFVEFVRGREGEDAVVAAAQGMNKKELHGLILTVEEAKGPKREGPRPEMQRSEFRIRVEGMPREATWQDLKDFARGKKGLAPLYTEVLRGTPGVGIIEYHRREDMIEALSLIHNTELRGVVVQVYEDTPMSRGRGPERRPGFSRSPPGEYRRGDNRFPPRDRPRSRSRERYPPSYMPPDPYAYRRGRSRSRSPPPGRYPPPYPEDPYRRGGPLPPPPQPAFYDNYDYHRDSRARSRSPPPRYAPPYESRYASPPSSGGRPRDYSPRRPRAAADDDYRYAPPPLRYAPPGPYDGGREGSAGGFAGGRLPADGRFEEPYNGGRHPPGPPAPSRPPAHAPMPDMYMPGPRPPGSGGGEAGGSRDPRRREWGGGR